MHGKPTLGVFSSVVSAEDMAEISKTSQTVLNEHLLSGFSIRLNKRLVQFEQDIPIFRICSLCGSLPDGIHCLKCRHFFCPECIEQTVAGSGVIKCPYDEKTFSIQDVQKYNLSEEEVYNYKARCLNSKNGCKFIGTLDDVMTHYLEICQYFEIRCQLCFASVLRNEMLNHARKNCKDGLRNSSISDSDRHLDEIKTSDISTDDVYKIKSELEESIVNNSNSLKEYLARHMKAMELSLSALVKSPGMSRIKEDQPRSQQQHQESSSYHQSGTTCPNFTGMVRQTQQALAVLENRLIRMENKLTVSRYVWRVKNFSSLKKKAKLFSSTEFNSESFYVGEKGYRMRLEGTLQNRGSDALLGLYMCLQRGPHDNVLEWPFKRRVTFVLINCVDETKHKRKSIKPLVERPTADQCFKRPDKDNMTCWGFEAFATVNEIESQGFVEDDSIVLYFITGEEFEHI